MKLAEWYEPIRAKNTVVMCHGVFDVLHCGHLYLFEAAKKLGTYLIISMVGDLFVRKGPGRPVFNENERAAMLLALRVVDQVVITSAVQWWPEHLERYTPHVYVRGDEGLGLPEAATLSSLGVKTIFIPKTSESSTGIADRIRKAA